MEILRKCKQVSKLKRRLGFIARFFAESILLFIDHVAECLSPVALEIKKPCDYNSRFRLVEAYISQSETTM